MHFFERGTEGTREGASRARLDWSADDLIFFFTLFTVSCIGVWNRATRQSEPFEYTHSREGEAFCIEYVARRATKVGPADSRQHIGD